MEEKLNQAIHTLPHFQALLIALIPYFVVLCLLTFLPPFFPTYYLSMLTKTIIFAIFAMSLNLLMGYTGLLSLGHAAYLGVAGYTVAIFMVRLGIHSFWILTPLAILLSMIVAAIIGYLALRVSGVYFLLINIAFGELLSVIAVKWRSVTGGSDGLVGIGYPSIGLPGFAWTGLNFYYLVLIVFAICCFLMHRIVNSPFGHAIMGIKENEARMQSLGYHTWLYKYIAFVLAGAFGGVAGALFAPFYGAMMPTHLALSTSSTVMLMVVIGSPGTLYGPVIGSLIVLSLEHFASIYNPERWPLILGSVFVVCVLFLPGGVGLYISRWWRKIRSQAWNY